MHATPPAALDARFACPEALPSGVPRSVLGVVAYGGAAVDAACAPLVRVPLEPLGGAAAVEVWTGAGSGNALESGWRGAVELARRGGVLFGHLRDAAGGARLEASALACYRELLAATGAEGYPHLLRVWACVPGINREEAGLERYQAFCRARATAFEEAWGSGFTGRLPASTAVGSSTAEGDLVLHFLASRTPGVHVENPRQVAAYRYPDHYGPRSPSFARATRAPAEAGGLLFVSGTASIVGHESVHAGLAGQTRETVRNLERVRVVAEAGGGRFAWSLLKVYLRNRSDEPEARRLLGALVPGPVAMTFLRADLCRRELLVEIEAVARPAE